MHLPRGVFTACYLIIEAVLHKSLVLLAAHGLTCSGERRSVLEALGRRLEYPPHAFVEVILEFDAPFGREWLHLRGVSGGKTEK